MPPREPLTPRCAKRSYKGDRLSPAFPPRLPGPPHQKPLKPQNPNKQANHKHLQIMTSNMHLNEFNPCTNIILSPPETVSILKHPEHLHLLPPAWRRAISYFHCELLPPPKGSTPQGRRINNGDGFCGNALRAAHHSSRCCYHFGSGMPLLLFDQPADFSVSHHIRETNLSRIICVPVALYPRGNPSS